MFIKKFFSFKPSPKSQQSSEPVFSADQLLKIRSSKFFDSDWYKKNNQDIDFLVTEPFEHFINKGFLESRDPSPEFSVSGYYKAYPDVFAEKLNPLAHYVLFGEAEGRSVFRAELEITLDEQLTRLKLSEKQAKVFEQLAYQTVFFSDWYIETHKLLGLSEKNALKHFLVFGANDDLDPSPFFSMSNYKLTHKTLLDENTNALWHFTNIGRKIGIKPTSSALFESHKINEVLRDVRLSSFSEQQLKILDTSNWFDRYWYIRSFTDGLLIEEYAAKHYLLIGEQLFNDPCAWFSTQYYHERHKDVVESGVNLLYHYLNWGLKEQREIKNSSKASELPLEQRLQNYSPSEVETGCMVTIRNSSWFDRFWYVETYRELNISPDNAVKHYCVFGILEERDPCPYFSTSFYLMCHDDVAKAGLNPLAHYISYGRKENREIAPSKYARLDLSGVVIPNESNSVNIINFSNFYLEDPIESEQSSSNGLDKESIIMVGQKVGEANANLFEPIAASVKFFEILCDSYKTERKYRGEWVEISKINFTRYLQDVFLVGLNTIKLRCVLPEFLGADISVEVYQPDINSKSVKNIFTLNTNVTAINIFSLELDNVFCPVLLLFKSAGIVFLAQVIPFPSLFRGGLHESEIAIQTTSDTQELCELVVNYTEELLKDCEDFEKISEINYIPINMTNISGNELLFDKNFMNWMKFSLSLEYVGYLEKPKNPLEENRLLYLSQLVNITDDKYHRCCINPVNKDCVPTIKLMLNAWRPKSQLSPNIIVPAVLCDGKTKIVKIIAGVERSENIKYLDNIVGENKFPSAIVQFLQDGNEAVQLSPIARDQEPKAPAHAPKKISILVFLEEYDLANQDRLWSAIWGQKNVEITDIIICLNSQIMENLYLPSELHARLQIVKRKLNEDQLSFYNRCVMLAKEDLILHLVDFIILYDEFAFSSLVEMISNSVKSSTCTILQRLQVGKEYKLKHVKNSYYLDKTSDHLKLSFNIDQSFFPKGLEYAVLANRPMFVAFDKQQMTKFLNTHTDGYSMELIFFHFGIYLASKSLFSVHSTKLAVGVDISNPNFEFEYLLEEQVKNQLSTFKNSTEEARGDL